MTEFARGPLSCRRPREGWDRREVRHETPAFAGATAIFRLHGDPAAAIRPRDLAALAAAGRPRDVAAPAAAGRLREGGDLREILNETPAFAGVTPGSHARGELAASSDAPPPHRTGARP